MTHDFDQIQSPFARLRALLNGTAAGAPPIDMSIGEPRHGMPGFVASVLSDHAASYGKYPPINGVPELNQAIARWLIRRYPRLEGAIDPSDNILPLNGSREGLFSAIFPALRRKAVDRPAVLMPNPFYQAYLAATLAAGAEPVFLPAGAATGHLPDLAAIDGDVLRRAVAMYLATPANPQGAAASAEYLARLVRLARQHDFMLFLDECYSEIYIAEPPAGGLVTAQGLGGGFRNVACFNSLSKRSSAPGLRSGFVAGDAQFLSAFGRFRNVAAPQTPIAAQHAAAALWLDEVHVDANRALYIRKFEAAKRLLGMAPNFRLPDGGFFLWLDLTQFGGGEAAAKTFWKGCGVKILPGAYLAQTGPQGDNPGEAYARLALVDSLEMTEEALTRISRQFV